MNVRRTALEVLDRVLARNNVGDLIAVLVKDDVESSGDAEGSRLVGTRHKVGAWWATLATDVACQQERAPCKHRRPDTDKFAVEEGDLHEEPGSRLD